MKQGPRCARGRKQGQSLPEYVVGASIMLLMALGAVAAFDLDAMVPNLLSANVGGTFNGGTVTIPSLGGG